MAGLKYILLVDAQEPEASKVSEYFRSAASRDSLHTERMEGRRAGEVKCVEGL